MKKTTNRIQFTVAAINVIRYQPFYDYYGREIPRWLIRVSATNGAIYDWLTSVEARIGMIIRATPVKVYGSIIRITQGRVVGFE